MDNSKPDKPSNEDKPLDEATLQAKLEEYRKALESEFKVATTEKADEKNSAEEITRRYFKEHVPIAAAQIVHLMQNSSSDAVKLSASKAVITQALKSDEETGDPLQQLLIELGANDSKKKKKSTRKPDAKNGVLDE